MVPQGTTVVVPSRKAEDDNMQGECPAVASARRTAPALELSHHELPPSPDLGLLALRLLSKAAGDEGLSIALFK